MSEINGQRFLNYAKWDLAINKGFYRAIAVVTTSLIFMVTIFGFFIRLTAWNATKSSLESQNVTDYDWYMSELNEALGVNGTAYVALVICSMAIVVFAGCINHPLRNKQGRITTLTLPATSKEKFLWHVLLMLGGGSLLCVASYALADLLNAALSVVTFGAEGTRSLIGCIVEGADMFLTEVFFPIVTEDKGSLLVLMMGNVILSYPFQITLFAFGNALKYKFNILITIIAIQVVQFVLSILFFIVGLSGAFAWFDRISEDDFWVFTYVGLAVLFVAQIVLMVLMWRKSYKLYCKSQVTSAWNK